MSDADGKAGKGRRTRKRVSVYKDLGPNESHTMMVPRMLWKDMAKKAIDEDTTVSALFVQWAIERMARFGYSYGTAGQGDEAKTSVQTLPMSETVTPSEVDGGGPLPGAGEGTGDSSQPRLRKRA